MNGPTSLLGGAALLILVAVTETTSSAATAPTREGIPREPDLRAYRHLGPFFYAPALRVKARGYEDNVFMDRENPEGDFRATLGPELRGVVRFKDEAWVVLHGAVDYSGYAKHSSLIHFDRQHGIETNVDGEDRGRVVIDQSVSIPL